MFDLKSRSRCSGRLFSSDRRGPLMEWFDARRSLLAIGLLLVACQTVRAELPALDEIPVPTLGGKQFWSDELFFHAWRIQRNAVTGHCRLLDGKNVQHGFGDYEHCRERLDIIRSKRQLPPMTGKGVVVLHGLMRSRSSMNSLCRRFREEGYMVFNVGYPTTRRTISQQAESLDHIVRNLEGIEEINFVAHSLGNIVVRHYLGGKRGSNGAERLDPRIKRFVMLGPPNHGSLTAKALKKNRLFGVVTGEAVRQLGTDWKKLEPALATPSFEFGIIAGGLGNHVGYNPALPGDNDGVVTVASTRLVGARDFVVVPALHSFLLSNKDVGEYAIRFLQEGHFIDAAHRTPVATRWQPVMR